MAKDNWVDKRVLRNARKKKAKLVFDRFEEQQPQCTFGMAPRGDVCCKNCYQGPCRIIPGKQEKGICGAGADTIVARNLVRHTAAGAAQHTDHAREAVLLLHDIAKGKVKGYKIKDEAKLRAFAKKLGKKSSGPIRKVAEAVALEALEDFRRQEGMFQKSEGEYLNWLRITALPERIKTWKKLGILPINADMETSHALHQTAMGVDADPVNLLMETLRLGLVDGYAGLHLATDMQDIIFGTPKLTQSMSNLGVIKPDYVNIAVHGHMPIMSEKVVEWAGKLKAQAKKVGAKGVNLVGVCCTGNEILMRHGIPLAGHEMQSEMVIATGAVEAMVVDVQCIYPSVQDVASCFHTKIITTMDYARIPGAIHIPLKLENADKAAKEIIMTGIRNFRNRQRKSVCIPNKKTEAWAGFSAEMILAALSKVDKKDPLKPLIDNIVNGNILGIAAVVGCRNPKLRGERFGEKLIETLIKNNVLVVVTGCMAHTAAQNGLMNPNGAKMAGKGLRAVLTAIGKANGLPGPIPPVLHMGSCVDNSRIETVLNAVASKLNVPIHKLPVAASAPEYQQEKAVSIGVWALTLGIATHINPIPPVTGSQLVTKVLTEDLEKITGGKVLVATTPEAAAKAMIGHIKKKRKGLGLK